MRKCVRFEIQVLVRTYRSRDTFVAQPTHHKCRKRIRGLEYFGVGLAPDTKRRRDPQTECVQRPFAQASAGYIDDKVFRSAGLFGINQDELQIKGWSIGNNREIERSAIFMLIWCTDVRHSTLVS